jgi:hypothetical protein
MSNTKQRLKELSKGTAMAICPQHGFHFHEVFDLDELAAFIDQPKMGLENPMKEFFAGIDPAQPGGDKGITIIINNSTGDTIFDSTKGEA